MMEEPKQESDGQNGPLLASYTLRYTDRSIYYMLYTRELAADNIIAAKEMHRKLWPVTTNAIERSGGDKDGAPVE